MDVNLTAKKKEIDSISCHSLFGILRVFTLIKHRISKDFSLSIIEKTFKVHCIMQQPLTILGL
jgi:hypothetical protein